ncbi:MAG TPA: hypothetical protein VHI13_11710 [Candidatus Kapabacteria bacterium]|nr:hypothetical protein [Candidatus Kapabacteria bacterium]
MSHLGGPLTVFDDAGQAIGEIRDFIDSVRGKLETALDAVPQIQQDIDAVTNYMPWLIGVLGFLGVSIIVHAIVLKERKGTKR